MRGEYYLGDGAGDQAAVIMNIMTSTRVIVSDIDLGLYNYLDYYLL